ncbi:SUMF1/EgtB/PvdO family nonheme iron enzyme [Pseudomonas lijiangensis]|uniref:formylglycine-generating enzyme family protein n=1 Tax=Pseudomonas syringae group TaxID=136849 RepID=UPI001A06A4A6|nr:SUMF1/EgtB/PvdO family nonheme iron enzyme [Pseudomonas cichorii]GFM68885.1 hypothetical protein PSCICJ_50030 [Pseudomonas cichorii]
MLRPFLIAMPAMLMMVGCNAESGPLPKSQSLTPEKVAAIAATINIQYPALSNELRGKVLSTVVQSIDYMVFVEGGQFDMGDFGWICEYDEKNVCEWPCGVESERMCNISPSSDDDFVHPVKLSSYYLSRFQTTLGDFDLFFIANQKPLYDQEDRKREDLKRFYKSNLPAPTKSWQEAKDYCQWLGKLSGYAVDLPTEAQWEYAARSRGQHLLFPTDSGSLDYGKNFPEPDEEDNFPVDRFAPNSLGIAGLSGNSTDWVNDWYGADYYKNSPLDDPQGPPSGSQRIKRGSDISEGPLIAAPIVRRWASSPVQEYHYSSTSFRCAIQSGERL